MATGGADAAGRGRRPQASGMTHGAPAPARAGPGRDRQGLGDHRAAARSRSCWPSSSARSSSSSRSSSCRASRSIRCLPLTAYAALLQGAFGSFDAIVDTLVATSAARLRRPGGRARLQGRPVQHRRPGPVPDGRPRRRLRSASRVSGQPPIIAIPLAVVGGILGGAATGASSPASSRRSRAPTRS